MLDLPTLKYRRMRGDLITIYKLVTGRITAEDGPIHLKKETRQTRGHSLRLAKFRVKKRVRRSFLTVRACNQWNRLPERIVGFNSTQTFKTGVDEYLWCPLLNHTSKSCVHHILALVLW